MFITLYFIVTRFPDSLRSVRDHFLSLDPTILTIDLLKQHLLAAKTSIVAESAARGTPRTPFFEGCSPSPLAPSYASAAAVDVPGAEDVGATSASAKRRSSKGKGGRGGGGGSGGGGGGSSGGGGGNGGGGSGGSGGGSGGFGGNGGGSGGGGGNGDSGSGGGRAGATQRGGLGGSQRQQQQRRSESMSPQQLREWFSQRGASWGSGSCPYVIRMGDRAGQTCGKPHTQHRCFSRLDDAWRAEFEAAALGASESVLPSTAPAEALHSFTLESGASCCFFCDSTTLTPLFAPVSVKLADPSRGPVLARSSTVFPCPAVPSGPLSSLDLPSFSTNLVSTAAPQDAMVTTTTPGGQRVSICMCTRMRHHLATFTRRPGLSLYTLATEPPQVAASSQVSASGQVAAPCSCRLLSHQTLLWHHCLGHPSLPCLRGMHSRLLVSGLPRSLPPLPPLPAPPSLPCVEGLQLAAPHSSFPLTTSPLQTLHMDVWWPARGSGQGRERYFLLVVDDYTRHLQLRERFRQDLPVLRLHSDRGGEFSSDLLWDFSRGEGILCLFTLPDSPQQNGIAEHRIGLVMDPCGCSPFSVAIFGPVRCAPAQPLAPCLLAGDLAYTALDAEGCVFPSLDVTFDESVPFYHVFPYRSAPPLPPPLFLALGSTPVDPLPPQGPASSGVSQVDPLLGTVPVEVVVRSGAARGAASGGAELGGSESEGARSGGAEPGGAEPGGAEPRGAESEGAESGGAEPWGIASSGGPAGASPRLSSRPEPLSPLQLCELFAQRARLWSGASGAGVSAVGDTGVGGVGVNAGAGGTRGAAAAGPGGARTRGTGAAGTGTGAGGTGAGGAGAGETGAVSNDTGAGGIPASPISAPSPYTKQTGGLIERCEPESRPASPVRAVRTCRRVSRLRPPPVLGTHAMALCSSSVPLHVLLPPPPESSLPAVPDSESDLARDASPTVSCLLAIVITDPSFESTAASALVAELVDFASACRLDYAIAFVAESESAGPPSVGGECALGTDVLEDSQEDIECLTAAVPRFASMLLAPEGDSDAPDIQTPRSYAEAITGPYSSKCQAAMDAEMASWKSTGTYVDAFPPSWVNIVDGMWIFRMKRPRVLRLPSRRVTLLEASVSERGSTNSRPSPPPLLHVVSQRDYELHSLDFSTDLLQGSLHEEISLTTLATLGFTPSAADPSLFLRTNMSLPPFYVPVYIDDLVFATADTEALTLVKSKLQKRHTCTDLGELRSYLGLQITRDRARRTITLTQSHMVNQVLQRFGFQFSSPQPTPLSTGHLSQLHLLTSPKSQVELRWLTYLLPDLGEQPRSPLVLYVDNKAMIALCEEHILEHRTKHIALRYFLARELQQRGQLRLAYVATRANTADIFTKALPPGDHQRFCSVLGLVPTLPHLLTA
ncbi:unnamed protein product [Closterium sp. NIES-54]